jgi:hypothetical protein
MPRPWNRIVVDDDPDVIEEHPDGRLTQGFSVAMCDEDVEAMRQGYKCIGCFENLDHAFPKDCPVCGFPMQAEQAERFARIYKGHKLTRTGVDWEAQADRLEEQKERRAFEKRAAESGIVVPRGIS